MYSSFHCAKRDMIQQTYPLIVAGTELNMQEFSYGLIESESASLSRLALAHPASSAVLMSLCHTGRSPADRNQVVSPARR